MRFTASFFALLLIPVTIMAEEPADGGQPPPDDIGVGLVPLVDSNAPLTAIWFTEGIEVSIEDSSAIEGQFYTELSKRTDIRLLSREKTRKIIDGTGKRKLQQCKWENPCLYQIGKLLEADRIIGIKLTGTGDAYYLALKRIDLKDDKLEWLTTFVNGGLSTLMVDGIAKGVKGVIEKKTRPMPRKLLDKKTSQAPEQAKDKALAAQTKPEDGAPKPSPTPSRAVIVQPVDPPKARLVEPKPQDELARQAERPGFFKRHMGSTIVLGAALVLTGGGIGFGVMANKAQKDVEFQWDPARDEDGKDNALGANVMFGLAGAAALTALVLFILEPSAEDAVIVAAGPGGANAAFRF